MKLSRVCFVLSFAAAIILGIRALSDIEKNKILLFPTIILLFAALIFLILSNVLKPIPKETKKTEIKQPVKKPTESKQPVAVKEVKEAEKKATPKPASAQSSAVVSPIRNAPVLVVHISGLDMPQNSPCQFSLNKGRIIITVTNSTDVIIPISEISRAEVETTMEVYNHYISGVSGSSKSSKYGTAGNMIAEKRKEKSTALETEYYLILERNLPAQKPEYLVFNCGSFSKAANSLKDYIKNFSQPK